MRPLAIAAIMLGACATLPIPYGTPPGHGPLTLHPHEVEYEMLATVSGEACGDPDMIAQLGRYRSPDPRAIGRGMRFEQAKYEAIKESKGDGLIGLRARVTAKGAYECVTVTARAYKILKLRAVAAPSSRARDE